MASTPIQVSFDELFEKQEGEARYSARAAELSGREIEIEGFLAPLHADSSLFLLTEGAGECPDCSLVPLPAIFLPDLKALNKAIAGGGKRVSVCGTLGFGLEVDVSGYASFLRIKHATI